VKETVGGYSLRASPSYAYAFRNQVWGSSHAITAFWWDLDNHH